MKSSLALLLVAAHFSLFAQAQSRPAKPGDVHLYAVEFKADRLAFDETVTVLSTDGGTLKTRHVRSNRPGEAEGRYTAEWAAIQSGTTGNRMEPAFHQVPRPLQVGSSQPFDSVATLGSGATLRFKGDSIVAAQEKLVTPAGEFDVYRIEQKGYLSGISFQGGFAFTQKIWYAPSIDRMVRVEYKEQRSLGADNVFVLKQFKPAD
jgi:hypothetical protein